MMTSLTSFILFVDLVTGHKSWEGEYGEGMMFIY